MLVVMLVVMLAALPVVRAHAAAPQRCGPAAVVLWGDGRHDDTQALNAWFGGREAIWGESGAPVGAAIAGHRFRLSSAVYVPGGTGRRLDDFYLRWPARGEIVSGGTIRSGTDRNKAPIVSGVRITGGDPGEDQPFEAPDPAPAKPDQRASCATS